MDQVNQMDRRKRREADHVPPFVDERNNTTRELTSYDHKHELI